MLGEAISGTFQKTTDGRLIDPYGGQLDLKARQLRHVSPAFPEDPLRVLRVARFAARFAALNFRVADETLGLMPQMSSSGELAALVPERVWQETRRALEEQSPQVFFEVLRECGALAQVFPELEALFGVPQPEKWHPEVDTGVHTLMVVKMAAALSPLATVRFAALVHDLGKADTPRDKWPRHAGHEVQSVQRVQQLCARLRIPNDYRDLAVLVARHHGVVHRAFELRAATVLDLFTHTDALRRPERFEQFLLACESDARGRKGLEQRAYPQADWLRAALSAAAAISPDAEELQAGGAEIAAGLRRRRSEAIAALKRQ